MSRKPWKLDTILLLPMKISKTSLPLKKEKPLTSNTTDKEKMSNNITLKSKPPHLLKLEMELKCLVMLKFNHTLDLHVDFNSEILILIKHYLSPIKITDLVLTCMFQETKFGFVPPNKIEQLLKPDNS